MEDHILEQEQEEQAKAARIKACKEKFAAAARDKINGQEAKDVRLGSIPEEADERMEDVEQRASQEVVVEQSRSKCRGSKFRKSHSKDADAIAAQIKEHKHMANASQVLAAFLRDAALTATPALPSPHVAKVLTYKKYPISTRSYLLSAKQLRYYLT